MTTDSDSGTSGVQPHQAAQTCRDLGSNWFLPAINELQLIYNNRFVGVLDGSFDTDYQLGLYSDIYWSSTEVAHSGGKGIQFSSGPTTGSKALGFSVRCTRR